MAEYIATTNTTANLKNLPNSSIIVCYISQLPFYLLIIAVFLELGSSNIGFNYLAS